MSLYMAIFITGIHVNVYSYQKTHKVDNQVMEVYESLLAKSFSFALLKILALAIFAIIQTWLDQDPNDFLY